MPPTRPYRSVRRETDAAATRRDILMAARELFAAHGYARVTVADIAGRARIAVKTVYASAGTKADILNELLTAAVHTSGAEETLAAILETQDLESAMRQLARGTRRGQETHQETLDILFSSMASHETAEDIWRQATEYYRETLRRVAEHLHARGLLAPGLDVGAAADRLWFCFGLTAWRTLIKDCGWPYDEAERWLCGQGVGMLGDSSRA
jgi:AcrR family transcriptional regulator